MAKYEHVSYLKWIQKTRVCKQALLVECAPRVEDTPEHFYHTEMVHRSTLYHRCKVHGVKFKKEKS